MFSIAWLGGVPALLISILYGTLLAFRRDYLGHFAAGYGGTLGATLLSMAALSRRSEAMPDDESRFARAAPAVVVALCLACIALGAACELTVFRMAKFDEVDFCNQSLGALLAALVVLAAYGGKHPDGKALSCGLVLAACFLALGFFYAFT